MTTTTQKNTKADDPIASMIELGVSSFIPDKYRDYKPIISDSLCFFLDQVTSNSRTAIAESLRQLDPDAAPIQGLVAILHHCPTLHKIGQLLARDDRLDESVRTQLQYLESFPASFDVEQINDTVRQELGDAIKTYEIEWSTEDAMEASVAYVIPATWKRPGSPRRDRAMLKILKPDMETRLRAELNSLASIADLLDVRCDDLELPRIQYRRTFDALETLLRQETDLGTELQHLHEAWNNFRTNTHVQIPRPLEFSTNRCLAMRFMPGEKITDAAQKLKPSARRTLAANVAKILIFDVLLTKADSTIIHGDPHAGNLQFTTDERVGILDWSLVDRIRNTDRIAFAAILLGGLQRNGKRIDHGIRGLDAEIPDDAALQLVIKDAVTRVRNGQLAGFNWFTELLDELLAIGVTFPARLLMLRKNVFTLEGVLRDIDPNFSIERAFAKQAAYRFALDLPHRFATHPFSRDYRLPLATTDILGLSPRLPGAVGKLVKKTYKSLRKNSEG